MLEIAVSENGSVRQLRLTGELDLAGSIDSERLPTTDQTPGAPRSPRPAGTHLHRLVGPAGAIMADHRACRRGRFIVVRGPDRVNEVLEMTGVAQRIGSSTSPPAG